MANVNLINNFDSTADIRSFVGSTETDLVTFDESTGVTTVADLQATNFNASVFSVGSGTDLNGLHVYTATITPAEVAATTFVEQEFTVTGVAATDIVLAYPQFADTKAVDFCGARASDTNKVKIRYHNGTAGALTPDAGTVAFVTLKLA